MSSETSPRWIDAHCHLADPRLEPELEAVLDRSRQAGVTAWIQGGISPEDWQRQRELRKKLGPAFLTAFGLHPWWVIDALPDEIGRALDALERALPEADALGELGLDFSEKRGGRATEALQIQVFEAQLQLTSQSPKPLILHVVKAHAEALGVLKASRRPLRGLVHSFSASGEIARQYLDLGLTLSVSGVVARSGYETLKRAIAMIPANRLVVETDSPDQPLQPGLNEPACLKEVAEAVGMLRKEKSEAILDQSASNLRILFPKL